MRRTTRAAIAAAIALVAAPATAAPPPVPEPPAGCDPPASGRIGLWRAEATAEDSVGSHHGATTGATAGHRAGLVGQAFALPGDEDHVAVPDAQDLNAVGDLTLETWVRLDDTVFGVPDDRGVGGDRVLLWKAGEHATFGFWIEGDAVTADNAPLGFIAGDRTAEGAVLRSEGLGWQKDTWYHVAVTRSGTSVRFFRDGQPIGEALPGQAGTPSPGSPLTLGAVIEEGVTYSPIKGALDEIGLWSRALGDSEIRAIHDTGTGACATPPSPPPPEPTADPAGTPPADEPAPTATFEARLGTSRFLPALLDAGDSTRAINYAWDLNADGRTDVDCGNQPQLVVRPLTLSSVTLTVTSGDGRTASQQQPAPLPGPAPSSAVTKYAGAAHCIDGDGLGVSAADLTQNGGPPAGCNEVVAFGIVRATGCFESRETTELQPALQNPIGGAYAQQFAAEPAMAGYLRGAAGAGLIPSASISALQDPETFDGQQAVSANFGWSAAFDHYTTRVAVRINGLDFYPRNGSEITFLPALEQVVALDAVVKLGAATVRTGPMSLDVSARRGRAEIGDFELSGPLGEVASFPFVPRARIAFVTGGRSELPAFLAPGPRSRLTLADGAPPVLPATLHADNEHGLRTDAVDAVVSAPLWFGDWDLTPLSSPPAGVRFAYRRAQDSWRVDGNLRLGQASLLPPAFGGLTLGAGRPPSGVARRVLATGFTGAGPQPHPGAELAAFDLRIEPDRASGPATLTMNDWLSVAGTLDLHPRSRRMSAGRLQMDGVIRLGDWELGSGRLLRTDADPAGAFRLEGGGARTVARDLTFDGAIAGGGDARTKTFTLVGGLSANGIGVSGRACYRGGCEPGWIVADQDLIAVCLASSDRLLLGGTKVLHPLQGGNCGAGPTVAGMMALAVPQLSQDEGPSTIGEILGSMSTRRPRAKIAARKVTGIRSVEVRTPRARLVKDVLRYALPRVPGLEVTVVDRGPGADRVVGRARGGRGRLRVRLVADGRRHRLVARMRVHGLAQRMQPVLATYRAAPRRVGRVRRLTVTRRGGNVAARWTKVAGARRYVVVVRERAGHARTVTVRRPRAVIRGVDRAQRGSVSVRAVGRAGTPGSGRAARFRAVARPVSRFRPLSALDDPRPGRR